MKLFTDFFKFLNQPIVTLGLIAILVAIAILVITLGTMTPKKQVLYLSESERLGEFLPIQKMTPESLYCKDNKRFKRRSVSFTVKQGRRTLTLWLAKRGSAYTFAPASTPKGKAKKIGTIIEALETIWSKELIDKLENKYRDPLMKSEIFVTVELEAGYTPDGLPALGEEGVHTEANENMADLVGTRIKEALRREDWIRNMGLCGIGAAAVLIAQNMGLM